MNVVCVTILKKFSSGLFLLYRPTWILKVLHQKHLPGGFLNFCNSFLEAYSLPTWCKEKEKWCKEKSFISSLSVTQFLVFYNYLDCLGSSNCRQTQIASLKVLIKQKCRRCNLDKSAFFKKCIWVTNSWECEKCFLAFREKKIV